MAKPEQENAKEGCGEALAPDHQRLSGVAVRNLDIAVSRGTLEARLYLSQTLRKSEGLIVFFPCSGFDAVKLHLSDGFARMLAVAAGVHVLASTYTPAHKRPFPAAAEDAYDVLVSVVRQRSLYAWTGRHLIVAGAEAGGNLAAVAALMARDRGTPALSAQVLIMPMLDAGLTSCSMRSAAHDAAVLQAASSCEAGYRGYLPRAVDRTHPYASPLRSSRMKGLAPALILSVQDDPLCDEAEQYGAKLATAGIDNVVKRLPPIPFEQANARCECMRKEAALREITGFLQGLNLSAKVSAAGA